MSRRSSASSSCRSSSALRVTRNTCALEIAMPPKRAPRLSMMMRSSGMKPCCHVASPLQCRESFLRNVTSQRHWRAAVHHACLFKWLQLPPGPTHIAAYRQYAADLHATLLTQQDARKRVTSAHSWRYSDGTSIHFGREEGMLTIAHMPRNCSCAPTSGSRSSTAIFKLPLGR